MACVTITQAEAPSRSPDCASMIDLGPETFVVGVDIRFIFPSFHKPDITFIFIYARNFDGSISGKAG
jgi:hypothetical protein